MQHWYAVLCIVALTLGAALTGCGGASDEQQLKIRANAAEADAAITLFCLSGGPSGAEGVRIYTRLVRDWPGEKVDGRTIRQHAEDAASRLDGCGETGARYARQLDRALNDS